MMRHIEPCLNGEANRDRVLSGGNAYLQKGDNVSAKKQAVKMCRPETSIPNCETLIGMRPS